MCDVDLNSILSLRGDVPTRGHRYKVRQEHCTNNYRKNFLRVTSGPIWDSLPLSIVDFRSFTRFKLSLNNANLGILLLLAVGYMFYFYQCRLSGFSPFDYLRRRYCCCFLKPNSITLADSKLVRSCSQTGSKPNSITLSGSKLVGDQLRTSFEPDSVTKFGREPASLC